MTTTYQITNGNVVVARSSGRVAMVADTVKLRQDAQRALGIVRQPNGEGADLDTLIGTVPSSELAFSASVQRNVRSAFDVLRALQTTGQVADRTAAERLVRIARMEVRPATFSNQPEKTNYAFRVDLVSAAGQTATVTAVLIPSGV